VLVAVGSLNASKLEGVRRAFREVFGQAEVVGVRVEGLKPQPIGLGEIVDGARKRAIVALERVEGSSFGVGIEAGILTLPGIAVDVQAAFVASRDGRESVGLSPAFPLPRRFVEPLLAGVYGELEEVADRHFGTEGVGERGGVVKLLTRGRVTREDLTYLATLMALVAFENSDLYF